MREGYSKIPEIFMRDEFKQVLVVRKDLNLSAGKLSAQCCHATLEAYKLAKPREREQWTAEGQKKVILYAKDLSELMALKDKAKKLKLPISIIRDAGLTEIQPGTITCIGIGPSSAKEIDKVTGDLKLA